MRTRIHPFLSCALLSLSASNVLAQEWNPTADFSTASNPNGVWSYGWSPLSFATFTLHTSKIDPPAAPLWGSYLAPDSTPAIWKNTTGSQVYGIPNGSLSLHPGPGGEASILRWSNPGDLARGSLLIEGSFGPGDSGSMLVSVRIDGQSSWVSVDSGSFSLQAVARSTSTIDFAVYNAYAFGNTPLQATITFIPGCPSDFNDDGGVDGSDVEAFFIAWESGDVLGDFNEDGGIDGTDVEAFFFRWEQGC